MNVTDSQESFSLEFQKLNSNIDQIHDGLMEAMDQNLDPEYVTEIDRVRYHDMVAQMSQAVMQA